MSDGQSTDRERVDQCPRCETIGLSGWILGHHYCPRCDHTFDDSGGILCDGRYLDSGNEQSERGDRDV